MELYSSSSLPIQGDYAAGVRTKPRTRGVGGTFATGMSGASGPRVRHHGNFAAGIRSHLDRAVPGDFASRARVSESPATA
jgi:hypothetical protein